MDLEGLKLKEISLFLDLVKTQSIRELARQRGEPPGQISKAIRALEMKLGNRMIHRSTKGISLTAHATEILPFLEGIRGYKERLDGHYDKTENQMVMSIATTSFFSTHFVPALFGEFARADSEVHCRLMDLPPNQFIPVALRSGFDVCIHQQDLDWPKTWTSVEVGHIQWQLCCRVNHPVLQKKITLKEILNYPFVYPIYWTSEGIRHGNDNFPVPIQKRVRGFETATATSAAHIVAQTDQVGYLPSVVSRPLIQQKKLKVISVPQLKTLEQPVYLTVKSDAIQQKRFLWLKEKCQAYLQELQN